MNPEDLLEAALSQLLASSGFRTLGDGVSQLAGKFLSSEVDYGGQTATRYEHCEDPAVAEDFLDAVACLGILAGLQGFDRVRGGLNKNKEAEATGKPMCVVCKKLTLDDVKAVMPEVPYFASGLCQ